MSFLLACPNCGPRRVDEFRFGGELRQAPAGELSPAEWRAYLYDRANVAGPQREWWYHRQGCKRWFVATRDTTSNAVLHTAWFGEGKGESDAQARDPRSTAAAGADVSGLE
jgi:sarcosine oxidase subunit delta